MSDIFAKKILRVVIVGTISRHQRSGDEYVITQYAWPIGTFVDVFIQILSMNSMEFQRNQLEHDAAQRSSRRKRNDVLIDGAR